MPEAMSSSADTPWVTPAELMQFRVDAEAGMVDTCVIRRKTGEDIDPVTLKMTMTYETVYPHPDADDQAGRCRVRVMSPQDSRFSVVGGREWVVQTTIVQLPVVGSEGIRVDDEVTILTAKFDTQLVGGPLIVAQEYTKTHATMRRIRVEQETD